jgi:tetratricopeptide (TPR) repeat protein
MKMRLSITPAFCMLGLAALLCGSGSVFSQEIPADAVGAQIVIGKNKQDVLLVGRDAAGRLVYVFPNAPTVRTSVDADTVEILKLNLDFDRQRVRQALVRREWLEAATVMLGAVVQALPYLDLRGNPMTEPGYQTAVLLVRSGVGKILAAPHADPLSSAKPRELAAARRIFLRVAAADWFRDAEEARFWAIVCLVLQGENEAALAALNECVIPGELETGYGVCLLARGLLEYERNSYDEALDAAIQSALFESKSIDSFPFALYLTARCYETRGEWYRARDVWFELARLFENTMWHGPAVDRLRFIMDEELTAAPESAIIEDVFFGTDEDLNVKVLEYLQSFDREKEGKQ